MRCRQCGAEIADKALICYRCGTAATEAKFKAPPAGRRQPGSRRGLAIGVAIALLLLLTLLLFAQFG